MSDIPREITPQALSPLLQLVARLDLKDTKGSRDALEREFPFQGPFVQGVAAAMRAAVKAGTMCHRGSPPLQFSRPIKPGEDSRGLSADAVLMSAPGPLHAHPNGEVDLCFAEEGSPTFDGHPPGWVVFPPGSRHVPTVQGGTMLILYLLPGGAIEFLPAEKSS